MPVSFYRDVHVPRPITDELRRRGVDVLTAIEYGAAELADDVLLERAVSLGRIVFIQDIRFKTLAEERQRQRRRFSGLIFGHQLRGTIGQFVVDRALIAACCEPDECANTVQYIPF